VTYQIIAYKEITCSGANYPDVRLRMEILQQDDGTGQDAGGNLSHLRGRVFMVRRGTGGQGTVNSNNNVTASAGVGTTDPLWSTTVLSTTTLGYDWRGSSGMGDVGDEQVLYDGTFDVDHQADGTQTLTYAAAWNSIPGDILGDVQLSGTVVLPKITSLPGVPTALTATRLSDSLIQLAWSQSSPSNGQPTTNTIRRRINGGAWSTVSTIAPATSANIAAAADQKIEYQVLASNAAGDSAWSTASSPVYTTPDAPTAVAAVKDAALDINITWTPNVAFSEHEHVIEHSANGGAYAALTVVSSGTSTYKDVAPNPAQTHRYRVRSRNTSGALTSAWVESDIVQLVAAPNKPTLPDLADYASKDAAFLVPWTHNPVDSTSQTAYEVERSTNGGSSWTSTGKVTSTTQSYSIAGGTYAADAVVTIRVRTWGQATSGGSDTTGASPWSDPQAVTFKSAPVVTVLDPADASTWDQATLVVTLGFSQAESATFVQATVVLSDGVDDLETVVSGSLSGITFDTLVENGGTYTVTATVLDSNGVSSVAVESEFDVAYTLPVAAGVTITYLSDSGVAQIDLTIDAPGMGEAEAVAVTITRTIDGVREDVIVAYPIDGPTLTILDTTPTINGQNDYLVRTLSADGAINDVAETLTTTEGLWAFLSSGPGYATIVSFFGDLRLASEPAKASALMTAAGRRLPIALYGDQESLTVSGSSTILSDEGSTAAEIEAFLREAELVCYRDPTGRRMFGRVTGSLATPSSEESAFQYKVTEAT
jgi:hypothetical protein